MSTVEIRFSVDGSLTPWEVEAVRFPVQGQIPTAVRRITELRRQYPAAAISTERRGDIQRRPEAQPKFRYSIYVKEGAMLVSDRNSPTGFSVTEIEKQTLFSRPFTEPERESVIGKILEMFPNALLTEMKA